MMHYRFTIIGLLLLLTLHQSMSMAEVTSVLKPVIPPIPNTLQVDGQAVIVEAPQLSPSQAVGLDNHAITQEVEAHKRDISHPNKVSVAFHFPVTTTLTPGEVAMQQIKTVLPPTAFFVIGDDKRSLNWLKDHLAWIFHQADLNISE